MRGVQLAVGNTQFLCYEENRNLSHLSYAEPTCLLACRSIVEVPLR